MKFQQLSMFCFALYLLVLVMDCQSNDNLVVHIPQLGRIRGSLMQSYLSPSRNFQAFRGIPYAQPPIGDLRFNDPVAAKPWGDTELDATEEGPTCIQYDSFLETAAVKGQEDCLVLNVYTPNVKGSLPVMVWIHGGGWSLGSGNFETDVYGPHYILDRDVVLVTINYRLGPMGFLSTEDDKAPGNYGLLDQSMALKWVSDHIQHFGGNPSSVTIFGESAGSASAHFQVLSPHSSGLFHRAILQSGATSCPWALQSNVGQYTKTLAELVNCPTSSSSEIIQCLRNKEAEEIVMTRAKIAHPIGLGLFPVAFGPRVDIERERPFIPDDPAKLMAEKRFNRVPIMAGVTSEEGGMFSAPMATPGGQKLLTELNRDPLLSIAYNTNMEKRKDGRAIAQKIYDHYFLRDGNRDVINSFGQLSSDYGFFKCLDDTVKLFSRHNDPHNTYYYYYAHKSNLSYLQLLGIPPDMDFGVVHADELFMMFSSLMFPALTHPDDIKVSNIMLDLWTSFATDGTPKSEDVPDIWRPVQVGQPRYLKINASPKMIESAMPFLPNLEFWNQLLNPKPKVEL